VAVGPLSRGGGVIGHQEGLLPERASPQVPEGGPLGCQDGHFPMGQIGHPPGIGEEGEEVAGQEHLPLPEPHHHTPGVARPHRHHLPRLPGREDGDGIGPLQMAGCPAHRLLQRGAGAQGLLHQVGDDLRVGLGDEGVAPVHQLPGQGGVVLHNAVVDHPHGPGAVPVGVGVGLGGGAVGSPTGMPQPTGPRGEPPLQEGEETLHLARGFADPQGTVGPLDHHAGAIVAPVLQAGEAFQE
jgi:hypothetical protein